METTVTMPIEVFKSLESKANMLDTILNDSSKYVAANYYWDYMYYIPVADEVNTTLAKRINDLENELKSLRTKNEEVKKQKKYGWP